MSPFILLFSLFGLFSETLSPIQKSAKITEEFATQFQKEHGFVKGMEFHTGLGVGIVSARSCLFVGHQQIGLEGAQQLMQQAIEQLKDRLQTNKEDTDNFGEQLVWSSSVRINFWTKNWDRIAPPYIAEIQAHHGTIYYYQSNPTTQELILVHEEPYNYLEKEGLKPMDPNKQIRSKKPI